MSFIKRLQKNINKVTEGYFANWTPDAPIHVGDYGDIKAYRFTRDGSVNRYIKEVEIESVHLPTATFEKTDGLLVKAGVVAEGDAAAGKAKLDLKLGSEGAFLYHLKDLTNTQFKERREAFEKLGRLILSEKIKWKDDYVLVTEVKEAGRALVLVADSANSQMEIECSSAEPQAKNLASAAGGINYNRNSDRVIVYEIKQKTSLLFRVVGFTEVPPDGSPNGPISKLMARIRESFSEKLPKPEFINLRDYIEHENFTVGEFILPNDESVRICQKLEDVDSFIERSEREDAGSEEVLIEYVNIGKRQTYR